MNWEERISRIFHVRMFSRTNCIFICRIFPPKTDRFSIGRSTYCKLISLISSFFARYTGKKPANITELLEGPAAGGQRLHSGAGAWPLSSGGAAGGAWTSVWPLSPSGATGGSAWPSTCPLSLSQFPGFHTKVVTLRQVTNNKR